MNQPARRPVAAWLFVCAALVWLTLAVGGVTRLTHAGLSIADWQPLVGAMPPLDARDWDRHFARYRETPEYRLVNAGMSLAEFKRIFWWEYAHRLLGRIAGAAFLLPLLVFAWRGWLAGTRPGRLLAIFLLGAGQGALGWYMVKSGLVDDPRVSQYRLAAHLAMAFILFAMLLWSALGMLTARMPAPATADDARLRRQGAALLALAFIMAVSGAFVAGLRAGLAYGTFPLMDGRWIPAGVLMLDPWYLNFFNNPATVQFDHRVGAWLLATTVPWFAWRVAAVSASRRARLAALCATGVLAAQLALGIATLLGRVPIPLAAAHQSTAMLLFGVLVWLNHEIRTAARGAEAELDLGTERRGEAL